MSYAHLDRQADGDYVVKFTYDAQLVERLKALRVGARWSPERRLWLIPAHALRPVIDLLDELGYDHNHQRKRKPEDHARPTGRSWAVEMFAALPEHLHEPAFKALTKVLHPDIGGDHRAAQALIAANDQRRRRSA